MIMLKPIENITDVCRTCAEFGSGSRRFKLTAGSEVLRLSHRSQVYSMFLGGRLVIHMVDEAINFYLDFSPQSVNKTNMEVHLTNVVSGILRLALIYLLYTKDRHTN